MKITKPTLLVNEEVCRRNFARMVDKAKSNNVVLVPHFKTHQSHAIGEWFREAGVKAITVSSLDMALYFADAGWKAITIAFPINLLEIDIIEDLASRVALTMLIVDPGTVTLLTNQIDVRTEILIEIDCGYNRSGVWWEDHQTIQEIIDRCSHSHHFFKGFYCHSGQTYHADGKERILEIFDDSLHKLHDLQLRFADAQPMLSVGDTPSCSLSDNFEGVYSIHPGNFVFYDLTQVKIGSCREEDIGIILAAPVVSKNKERRQIVIHGGGVHLSKDVLHTDHGKLFGRIVPLTETGWGASYPDGELVSISQEHGIVELTEGVFETINIGDVVGVLPVHSCMTADVMGRMFTTKGQPLDHLKGSRYA